MKCSQPTRQLYWLIFSMVFINDSRRLESYDISSAILGRIFKWRYRYAMTYLISVAIRRIPQCGKLRLDNSPAMKSKVSTFTLYHAFPYFWFDRRQRMPYIYWRMYYDRSKPYAISLSISRTYHAAQMAAEVSVRFSRWRCSLHDTRYFSIVGDISSLRIIFQSSVARGAWNWW